MGQCAAAEAKTVGLDVKDKVDEYTIQASQNSRKGQKLNRNIVHAEFHRDVNEFYQLDGGIELGHGISGSVRTVSHRQTKMLFACKTLDKQTLSDVKLQELRNEIAFMATLDHPNILRLYEYFETKDTIYLIMHLCQGGELLDRLHAQNNSRYTEKMACKYVKEMLDAVRYCHDNNIVHRDLKLENFLLDTEDNDSNLKLIDFGLSAYYKDDQVLRRAVGTPYYVAPEVLKGAYTSACDIWSLGVIAYMLVSGQAPFYGRNDQEIFRRVRLGNWSFDAKVFKNVSAKAKGFIKSCLNPKDYERPTASDLQGHKWFEILEGDEPTTPLEVVDTMLAFHKREKLVKISMEVIAHTLNPKQVKEMQELFKKFDKDQSGEIKIEELREILKDHPKFSEADLKGIFEGIDVEDSGTIKYHEFLAATLNHQEITDANLKIAFEKISNRNGLINPEDLMDLLGVEGTESAVTDLMNEVGLEPGSDIDLPTFCRIMKGENANGEAAGRLEEAAFKKKKNEIAKAALGSMRVYNSKSDLGDELPGNSK